MQHQNEFIPVSAVEDASNERLPLGHKGQVRVLEVRADGLHPLDNSPKR